ncbi:MAG: hypothetical protein KKE16_00110 [Firmicutes bacterium]|nr:hypothetical protein [Bacillota bacterium]
MNTRGSDWYRLDNAAKIYPVLPNERFTHVFRVSATLNELINPIVLEKAIEDLRPRFPSFFIQLRHGLFWYFFEKNDRKMMVKPETGIVCENIKRHQNNRYYFTFFYYHNRISLEVFHALSDGDGAIQFLKAVIKHYLTLIHDLKLTDDTIFSVGEVPEFQEFSDCYEMNYKASKRVVYKNPSAYLMKEKKIPVSACGVINSTIPTAQLLNLAKKYNTTLTQFVASLLIYSVLSITENKKLKKKVISVTIPINLRPYFHSRTLRNFSLYFYTTYKPRDEIPDLKSIIEKVRNDFTKELVQDRIQNRLNNIVRLSKSFFVRIIPLPIKMVIFKIAYLYYGTKPSTMTFSNFGQIAMPEELKSYVKSFTFNLGSGLKPAIAMNSYNGITKIIFSRAFMNPLLEKTFFTYLTSMGLDVEIESNFFENNFSIK